MINKLYDRFKQFIKYNLSFLIFLLLFLGTFSIKTDYSIYKAGGSINISQRINRANDLSSSSGSFNMAYVGMIQGKLPFYLLAKIIPSWELIPNDEITYNNEETINDSLKRDHLYYEESISNAKLIAYKKSNIPFKMTKINNFIIYVDEKCSANLKIGDEIISYDGINYSDLNTLKDYIKTKKKGDNISLIINRDNKKINEKVIIFEEDDTLLIGVATVSIYNIKSEKNIIIDPKTSESGPSGGLILSLAIYDALLDKDITKGNKIVGTGAIQLDGTVTEIGGIKYKLAGAVKEKADLFIVPNANLKEALKYAKEEKYDIIIKGVSNFDEALEVLNKMEVKK
ncbi:MAG: PDZ domain-containing protein [Bacilli bacterium]|nr:PDZ domain-containing protein [Bacilli bacterium]